MKFYYLLISLLTVSIMAEAQPTLTTMTNYNIGDTAQYLAHDTTGYSPGAVGANVTWDFSSQPVVDSFKFEVVNKNTTTNGNQFPTATFAETSSNTGGGLGDIFINNTATEYSMVGIEAGGFVQKYVNPQLLITRPFNYNSTLTDTFRATYNYMSFSISGTGVGTTVADGYGTLILRDSTYTNVLRVRNEYTRNDTIAGIPINNQVLVTGNTTLWFDTAHKEPLMRVDSLHINSSFQNVTILTIATIKESNTPPTTAVKSLVGNVDNINAYTIANSLHLKGNLHVGRVYQLVMYNQMGQIVLSKSFTAYRNNYSVETPQLSTGIYIVELQEQGRQPVRVKLYHK